MHNEWYRMFSRRAWWVLPALVTMAAGCEGDLVDDDAAGMAFDVQVTMSEVIPTVGTVAFTVDAEGIEDAYVEFGLEDEGGVRAPAVADEDGTYTATLLGMKAGHDYHVRPVVTIDGTPTAGDDVTLTTGSVPSNLSSFDVSGGDPDAVTPGFIATSNPVPTSTAIILDTDGDYVWWYACPDVSTSMTRTLRSADGQWLYFATYRALSGESGNPMDSRALRVKIDGSGSEMIMVDGAHHDLVELPDGSLGLLVYDHRMIDGQQIYGDGIVEVRPDGTPEWVWSTWDSLDFDPEVVEGDGSWTHANAMDYDPEEDVYYVSIRNLNCIVKIDRGTGALIWQFGGENSDFERADGSTDFLDGQHQFQVLDDGILVFDNRVNDVMESRVVQYSMDPDTGIAEEVWEYTLDPPILSGLLGDVLRFDTGRTLVTWSMGGQMDELSADGELLWRINADLGGALGFTEHFTSFYE